MNSLTDEPIVCWDFDETLGYFRPLEFRYLGETPPPGMPAPRLKPGIRELIASLTEFKHVVTTAAIGEYAEGVLQEHGLARFFSAVIGREHGLTPTDGKDYRVVGERFGIDESQLARRLVIVGNDAKRDPDARYRGIVMIYDGEMVDRPSEPLGAALRSLRLAGESDLRAGFEHLLERARRNNRFSPTLKLEDGTNFGMDYWGSYADNQLHPMIISPR